jgi:hypothetical protein
MGWSFCYCINGRSLSIADSYNYENGKAGEREIKSAMRRGKKKSVI